MKKIIYAMLAVSMLAFGFAACSDDNNEGGTASDGSKVKESEALGDWRVDSVQITGLPADVEIEGRFAGMIVSLTKNKEVIFYGSDTIGTWSISDGKLIVRGTEEFENETTKEWEERDVTTEYTIVSFSKNAAVISIKGAEYEVYDQDQRKYVSYTVDETIYFSRLPEPTGKDVAKTVANLAGTWKLEYYKGYHQRTEEGRTESFQHLSSEGGNQILTLNEDQTFTYSHDYSWSDEINVDKGVWAINGNKFLLYSGENVSVEDLQNLPEDYWEMAQTITTLTTDFMVLNRHFEQGGDGGYGFVEEDNEYYSRVK
ncbi:MAG: hypothetical protein IJ154_06040 [Bacteroidales bacterium]|nr:hypothetical protein [Bacteroidales bacterium]